MLNPVEIKGRLERHFKNVSQIREDVFRAEKAYEGKPYAIYYFDISDSLSERAAHLTEYQDEVIGKPYFRDEESLKWNSYLLFLTSSEKVSDPEIRTAKYFIEGDRRYARKYVLSAKNLDEFVHSVVSDESAQPPSDVLSTWARQLADSGLDSLLDDRSLLEAVKSVEEGLLKRAPVVQPKAREVAKESSGFIDEFKLVKYRPHPTRRNFKFSNVNLIVGVNGVGKTSLLEAIEFFYCGRNKRNADASLIGAHVEALFKGAQGKFEVAKGNRPLQFFRDRNLAWYGQLDVRTNNLFQSFNRFNFLNTDAAVLLADSKDEDAISEDLSKLLVGPDASKTWQRINRVADALETQYRSLSPSLSRLNTEIAQLRKSLDAPIQTKLESDYIYTHCINLIKGIGWKGSMLAKDALPNQVFQPMNRLLRLIREDAEAMIRIGADSPSKAFDLLRHVDASANDISTLLSSSQENRSKSEYLTSRLDRSRRASILLSRLREYKKVNFVDLHDALQVSINELEQIRNGFLGFNDEENYSLVKGEEGQTVKEILELAVDGVKKAKSAVVDAERRYSAYNQSQSQIRSLRQQLRELTRAVLEAGHESDECPVCRSLVGRDEILRQALLQEPDGHEGIGESLLEDKRNAEMSLSQAEKRLQVSYKIDNLCVVLGLDRATVTVGTVLFLFKKKIDKYDELQFSVRELQQGYSSLQGQNFDLSEHAAVITALRQLQMPFEQISSIEDFDQALQVLDEEAKVLTAQIEETRLDSEKITSKVAVLIASFGFGSEHENPVKRIYDMRTSLQKFQTEWEQIQITFELDNSRHFSDIENQAGEAYALVQKMTAALANEERSRTGRAQDVSRLESLNSEVEHLSERLKRLVDAISVMKSIREVHSLSNAMEATLAANRKNIETIFSKIHSPREFIGLGASLSTLIRSGKSTETKLSEISTGQRAAYALSIFLALNSQLKNAPPVLLIDDPIAHIDDLNSLSFLDYLREVAIDGKRQIFFATANEKLASLFERKFSFLGEGFIRHDLTRDIEVAM